jgi:NAD(P)-dependent dehydrogenase (short-subunit alcohol dehydrogenase family)
MSRCYEHRISVAFVSAPSLAGPDLEGKVAVVTGGSRGIGKQTCVELAKLGARIVLSARTTEPREQTPGTLGDTVAAIRELGGTATAVPADLARPGDVDQLVDAALTEHGGVDILVNNAAYTVGRALWEQVPGVTRELWERGFAVNVTAPLMLIQGFWDSMRARGGGVIVNVTSGAALPQSLETAITAPGGALPEIGPLYGASKAALDRMANAVAHAGAPLGIAVIDVEPGFVLTETMERTFDQRNADPSTTGAISPTIPARAIAYLCSCADPMRYSGQVVSAPDLVEERQLV